MIVDSMTDQEITKAVLSEKEYVTGCALRFRNDFKSLVLKCSHFPYIKTFECTTPKNKTSFIVSMRAEKRGNHSNPSYSIYALYKRSGGLHAALVENEWSNVTIFPTHFFERYRERILKDESIPLEKVLHQFFGRFWGYCDMWVDEEKRKQIFDRIVPGEEVNMVGAYHEGMIFGSDKDGVSIAKTIISFDEFKKTQWPQFNMLMDGLVRLSDREFALRYLNSIATDKI